ncbi:unnamed protein product [Dibothriocephalus latus]|uniref:Uncharacterized protein n=1 Tax=Dibothriocephalus latus TaxID=60516 RepID=A0A3P7LSP4_DIBLA|nr:unnamed protein product [Dibothriocephalus latus]
MMMPENVRILRGKTQFATGKSITQTLDELKKDGEDEIIKEEASAPKPEIPVVPNIDLRRSLETKYARRRSKISPSPTTTISPWKAVADDLRNQLQKEKERKQKAMAITNEPNFAFKKMRGSSVKQLVQIPADAMQVRGEKQASVETKRVGAIGRKAGGRRQRGETGSKVVLLRRGSKGYSDVTRRKIPLLKRVLRRKVSGGEKALGTANDLVNILSREGGAKGKRELLEACQEILALDPGNLDDMRELVLSHMDSVQTKIGEPDMLGKSFNFLNLLKTALQREENTEPSQIPSLDRLFIQALINDMKRMMKEISRLTAIERMLWFTLPENYEHIMETYRELWNMLK